LETDNKGSPYLFESDTGMTGDTTNNNNNSSSSSGSGASDGSGGSGSGGSGSGSGEGESGGSGSDSKSSQMNTSNKSEKSDTEASQPFIGEPSQQRQLPTNSVGVDDKFSMLPDMEVFYGSSQQYDENDIQWQSQLPITSSSSSLHRVDRREDRDQLSQCNTPNEDMDT
jgi:hypothetical protein